MLVLNNFILYPFINSVKNPIAPYAPEHERHFSKTLNIAVMAPLIIVATHFKNTKEKYTSF
jgi:hypothetical protein